MPAFNNGRFIKEAINSVLAQSYNNWELLVVDDASTDNTQEVLNLYRDNPRIHLFKNSQNMGAAFSRNFAIAQSRGEYVAFLDADDFWEANKLKAQLDFLSKNSYKMVCSYYDEVDEKENHSAYFIKSPSWTNYKKTVFVNKIGCLTVMVDGEIARNNPIDATIKKRNDYALWLKYLKFTDVHCVPAILAHYRMSSNGLSSGNKLSLIHHHYYLYRKNEKFSVLKSLFFVFINVLLTIRWKIFRKAKKIKVNKSLHS